MALKIRLARAGAKKRPYYRIVVAEAVAPRDGRFIEKVGSYNPMVTKDHADRVKLVEDRIKYWLSVGAQPTDRVAKFLGEAKITSVPTINDQTKKNQPKAKAQERIREEAEKKAAAEAEAKAAAEAAAAPAPAEEPAAEEAPAE